MRAEYQPWGAVLFYMLAGSPMVVANLWDVTDRDIDRFSRQVIQGWVDARAGKESGLNMAVGVTVATSACRLKHLIVEV